MSADAGIAGKNQFAEHGQPVARNVGLRSLIGGREYGELRRLNEDAAKSLTEGFEETLTLHRLGLVDRLGVSLSTTNGLESILALVEQRVGKVDRWTTSDQRHRWLATALLEIEPRLGRLRGYRALPQLRIALRQTTTQEKEVMVA